MKIKVSEATNKQLNWLAAKAEGLLIKRYSKGIYYVIGSDGTWRDAIGGSYSPSRNRGQAGRLADLYEIGVQCCYTDGVLSGWMADSKKLNPDDGMEQYGATSSVAIVRCFVAAKLGTEVDVPNDLVENTQ